MADELIIDLGEQFQPVEPQDHVRVRNRRGWRAALVGAVVAAMFLCLSAAGPRPPSALARAADITVNPGSTAMVVGDEVFIAEVGQRSSRLDAYSLSNGRQLWSTRLQRSAYGSALYRVGGTVVVAYDAPTAVAVRTDGVDLTTGKMLWESHSQLADVRAGRLIVSAPRSAADAVMSSLDPVTGQAKWTQAVRTDCVSDLAAAYTELCPDNGLLRVIDLQTGAVRATRTIDLGGGPRGPRLPPATPLDTPIALTQTDNVILVGHLTKRNPELDGYSATDLHSLWSRPFFPQSVVQACGDVFCMYDRQIGTGVDPHTGRSLPFPGFGAVDHRGLVSPELGVGPVQLNTRHALVPYGMRPDPDGSYSGATALIAIPDSEPMRIPPATEVDTFLASVDATTHRFTILGRLVGAGVQSCAALGRYLACELPNSTLRLWRLDG